MNGIQYIAVTNVGQPINACGGRDFIKLGVVYATGMAEAKKSAKKQFGVGTTVLLPSEWSFMQNNPTSKFANKGRSHK